MVIPKEILDVERPKSTVVRYCFGKYIVIKRTCVRDGIRSIPVDLGKVGEIANGVYYPLANPTLKDPAEARKAKKAQLAGDAQPAAPGRSSGRRDRRALESLGCVNMIGLISVSYLELQKGVTLSHFFHCFEYQRFVIRATLSHFFLLAKCMTASCNSVQSDFPPSEGIANRTSVPT